MKNYIKFISLLLVGTFIMAGYSAPALAGYDKGPVVYVEGIKLLAYGGNNFATSVDTLKANFERADGNNVTWVDEYDFATQLASDDPDVLLLPRTHNVFSAGNLSAIETWFESGDKFLWIGGESDYAGYYDANNTGNPLLAEISSDLRLDSGSVEDPTSNDAAAYRVVVNSTGVSSDLTDYVTDGFNQLVMHGPTAVAYAVNSTHWGDLRTADLAFSGNEVNIVLNTSAGAIALDGNLGLQNSDYYAYNNVTGNYPMLVTQTIDDVNGAKDSMVAVSGESIFTDYKFMNGDTTEKKGEWHNGSVVIANLISYFFLNLASGSYDSVSIYEDFETETETEYETETETETETEAGVNVTVTEAGANVTVTQDAATVTADGSTVTVTQQESEGKSPIDPTFMVLGMASIVAMSFAIRRRN
jgi:hypothetical protein